MKDVLLQLTQRSVKLLKLFGGHGVPKGKERPARKRGAAQGALQLADTPAVIVEILILLLAPPQRRARPPIASSAP